MFAGEAVEAGRQRPLRGGHHNQHRATAALAVRSPSRAQDAVAILAQDLEAVSAERNEPQLPCSVVEVCTEALINQLDEP